MIKAIEVEAFERLVVIAAPQFRDTLNKLGVPAPGDRTTISCALRDAGVDLSAAEGLQSYYNGLCDGLKIAALGAVLHPSPGGAPGKAQ